MFKLSYATFNLDSFKWEYSEVITINGKPYKWALNNLKEGEALGYAANIGYFWRVFKYKNCKITDSWLCRRENGKIIES